MTEPICTCPITRDGAGAIVRAYLDACCEVHARQTMAHCPSCTCEKAPIIYTPELAAKMVGEKE